MNAFELLKKDHRKVSDLFKQLEDTTERAVKTREELFAKVKQELQIHSRIEEQILYPALREIKETHEITLEAIEEHNVVKQLLEELSSMAVDDEHWTAKLTVLKENVEHHVEEEEGEMFKDAREVLTSAQINDLGERLEAAKQEEKKAAASAG